MESFGQRVIRLRKARGWSQTHLGTLAGLSQSTISDIERGRNKGSTEIVKLATALGISSEALLTGKEDLSARQDVAQYDIEPAIRARLLQAFDMLLPSQRAAHLQRIEEEAEANAATARHVVARIPLSSPGAPERLPSTRLREPTKAAVKHRGN